MALNYPLTFDSKEPFSLIRQGFFLSLSLPWLFPWGERQRLAIYPVFVDCKFLNWSPPISYLKKWKEEAQFSSVQSLSRVWLFATPWIPARQASLSITNSQSPPKPMSIESVMPPNHLILCCPLLLLPSIFPSIRVFSNESALHIRWPKYWFQLQHQSFQWTPRTDLLQDGLVGSPWCPRDSQESSPTPQFKSINSSALSFLYSLTLTSIHDHWKNHSLD